MSFKLMPTKDSNEVLDYAIDLTAELVGRGVDGGADTIKPDTGEVLGVVWIVPSGLTMVDAYAGNSIATVWLGDGTVGESYIVSAEIKTVSGRIYNRSFKLPIRDR